MVGPEGAFLSSRGMAHSSLSVFGCQQWRANLLNVDKESGGEPVDELVRKCLVDFEAGMTDDLNTPRACAALFGLVKGCEKLSKSDAIDKDGAFVIVP